MSIFIFTSFLYAHAIVADFSAARQAMMRAIEFSACREAVAFECLGHAGTSPAQRMPPDCRGPPRALCRYQLELRAARRLACRALAATRHARRSYDAACRWLEAEMPIWLMPATCRSARESAFGIVLSVSTPLPAAPAHDGRRESHRRDAAFEMSRREMRCLAHYF